jgi:hypothetical protein
MSRSRSSGGKLFCLSRLLTASAVAFAGAGLLSSCSTVLSDLPAQAGGLPEGAPERPAQQAAYPAVHDLPPPRATVVLTEEEKKKVEAELAAMREQQQKRGAASTQPE